MDFRNTKYNLSEELEAKTKLIIKNLKTNIFLKSIINLSRLEMCSPQGFTYNEVGTWEFSVNQELYLRMFFMQSCFPYFSFKFLIRFIPANSSSLLFLSLFEGCVCLYFIPFFFFFIQGDDD